MTAQAPTLEATHTRRRAGVTLRLTTAAGSALLAAVACAGAGVVGLHSVSSRNHELSSIAVTLKDVAELRDAEGDMRVTVHVIGSATGADLTDALAEAHDEDVRADAAIDVLRKDLAGHDADLSDLQAFVAGLQKWRTIRDGQIATAAARGDEDSAKAVIDGPLSAADDAFAEPLDHMVEHVSAEVQPAREAGDSAVGRSTLAVALALALGLALATVLSVLTIRGIVRPLRRIMTVLAGLAEGDLTRTADIDTSDEMGVMARALDRALAQIRGTVTSLASSVQGLQGASEALSENSSRIAGAAQETATEVEVAEDAARQISDNVRAAAAGAEQMAASISEISLNASEAAQVATHAVEVAETANQQVAKLGASSAEIGDVVNVITSIAQQTNLLALNATIEAARAGQAGRGFAVVAEEVKQLAQQTAEATGQIGARIEAIQNDTNGAVEAIREITEVIERISGYQTTIASAVEEQTATTSEMSMSVMVAAENSELVTGNISGVARAATSTTSGVHETRRSADELARMSTELQQLVDRFRY